MTEGIKTSSLEERQKAFGSNAPPQAPIRSCMSLFFEAMNDLTLIILLFAAVISVVVHIISDPDKIDLGKKF